MALILDNVGYIAHLVSRAKAISISLMLLTNQCLAKNIEDRQNTGLKVNRIELCKDLIYFSRVATVSIFKMISLHPTFLVIKRNTVKGVLAKSCKLKHFLLTSFDSHSLFKIQSSQVATFNYKQPLFDI